VVSVKFNFEFVLIKKKRNACLGAVYSARAPNGVNVAVKVVDLDRMPNRGSQLVSSYLNEVRHLQRLKQESRHVVEIYDFDFDPRTGSGNSIRYSNNMIVH